MRARINRATPPPVAEIGKIKVGMKNEKGYPKSVDYFIATGKYAPLFEKFLGAKPNIIPIVFVGDNDNVNCNEQWEYRNNEGRVVARGDGELFEVWNGKDYSPFSKTEHPDIMERVKAKHPSKNDWFVTLSLRFAIPQIPIAGYWRLTTKGNASSIPQIVAGYDLIKDHVGTVTSTLFDLSVEFAKSQKPGDTSRYPVITLAANADPERMAAVSSKLLDNRKYLLNE